MYKGRLAYEFTLSKTSSAIISKTPGRNHSSQKGIRLTSDANGITVCYFCGQNSMVTADIFRIDGKLQKSLVAGYQTPGEHTLLWNYKFNNGRTLPPGLYLLRIKAGGNEMVRRFIMR
jgi:flagellar hook assembly protein FlgD